MTRTCWMLLRTQPKNSTLCPKCLHGEKQHSCSLWIFFQRAVPFLQRNICCRVLLVNGLHLISFHPRLQFIARLVLIQAWRILWLNFALRKVKFKIQPKSNAFQKFELSLWSALLSDKSAKLYLV
jgi:hypothetical protein